MDNGALVALKAAYENATEGEWELFSMGDEIDANVYFKPGESPMLAIEETALSLADLDFIVAAHTHVPALLAEVERLRAVLQGIDGYILHNHELFGEFDTTNAARIRVMVADALNAP